MRIIFIRHGDPDYANDTLTEKGWREAELLSDRVKDWNVKEFYCSPLGRAQATASLSLKKTNRSAITYDWMKEFFYPIIDPITGRHGVPWDFMPSYWTKDALFYDRLHWHEAEIFASNPDIKTSFDEICMEFDHILASYGYQRDGLLYHTPSQGDLQERIKLASNPDVRPKPEPYCNDTIVIFCHLGVTFAMMSHLLGIAPPLLWQNFFIAPASVTILTSEERLPGEAYFRAQVVGDTMHLHHGREPVSQAGYFAEPFLF